MAKPRLALYTIAAAFPEFYELMSISGQHGWNSARDKRPGTNAQKEGARQGTLHKGDKTGQAKKSRETKEEERKGEEKRKKSLELVKGPTQK